MRRVFSWLFLLIWIVPALLAKETVPDSLPSALMRGKEALYHFQLDKSLQIFQEVQKRFPQLPHGYFYQAYVLTLYYSQDQTNDSLAQALLNILDRSIEMSEAYQKTHPDDAEPYFYLGLSYGLKGIYYVVDRNYLKGYYYGRKGKNYLAQTIAIDSGYTDALLGLGIFHYYVDLMPGVLKIFAAILGFEGDRTRGLSEIRQTMQHGLLFRTEAEFVYASLRYFMEGEVWDALDHFEKLGRKYPENPGVKLVLGYHYRRFGQVREAIRYFQQVEDRYRYRLPDIYVIKYYNMAVCYYLLNQYADAENILNRLLQPGVRKSPFYQAALVYYKGIITKLHLRDELAQKYFSSIRLNKHTQYWYHAAQFYRQIPADSLFYYYTLTENDIFTGNISRARSALLKMESKVNQGHWKPANTTEALLLRDVRARFYFKTTQFERAAQIYREILPKVEEIPDKFQRAWIYIRYARVLRFMKEWKLAENMLEKARISDEEYTRFMIERELFMVQKHLNSRKS